MTLRHDLQLVTISEAQRAFTLAKAYQALTQYFAFWDYSSVAKSDLDAAFARLAEQTAGMTCRAEFGLAITRFLSRMNNLHTAYTDPLFAQVPPLGLELDMRQGQWLCTWSAAGTPARGDRIMTIDGTSMPDWQHALEPYFAGNKERVGHQWMSFYLRLFLGDQYSITYEDRLSNTHCATATRDGVPQPASPLRPTGRWIEGGTIAFIDVPSFAEPSYECEAVELVRQYSGAAGLLVDVRRNGGGECTERLASALHIRPFRYHGDSTPVSVGIVEARRSLGLSAYQPFGDCHMTWQKPAQQPAEKPYPGVLIFLTSKTTCSAAESFLMTFVENGRAAVVGETTAGSTGQPYMYRFPDGRALWIGTSRVHAPDGSRFEGVGIRPTVEICLTRDDLYEARDMVMETAVSLARRSIAPPTAAV